MNESLWYVYAVTRASGAGPLAARLTGVAGGQVRAIREDELAAVASRVSAVDFAEGPLRANLEDLRWLERTARDHQHVVDALLSAGGVVPLRLATVCHGTTGVRRLLAENRELFETAVVRLDGRAEWGLKIHVDPPSDHAPRGAPANGAPTNGAPTRPASGRDYLRRRREQRQRAEDAWRLAEAAAHEVHVALAAAAERTRQHPPQDARLSGEPGRNLLNAAYLVPRHRESEFAELAGQLAGEVTGLRITLSGPWAPYSFTADAAGAAAPPEDTPSHTRHDAGPQEATPSPTPGTRANTSGRHDVPADVEAQGADARTRHDAEGDASGRSARAGHRAEACAEGRTRGGARVTVDVTRAPSPFEEA